MVRKSYIKATPAQQRSRNPPPDRLRLLGDDKSELDLMIEVHLRRGWSLEHRSHSLDEGHGAVLKLMPISKAA